MAAPKPTCPSTSSSGLTTSEALHNISLYGYFSPRPNTIPEKKQNPWLKFLSYYTGPMPVSSSQVMIWIAIAIEAAVLDFPDLVLLLFLQFVNGFVGWYEERNAGNAIAALRENLAPKAAVKRDGQWQVIPSAELAMSDRIRLEIGDIVPADCIVDIGIAEIDQSALTGESHPVTKRPNDSLLQGTICKKGRLEALIVAVGADTYLGKTTTLVASVDQVGHFQKVLLSTTWFLSILSFAFTLLIFVVILVKGAPFLGAISICAVIIVASIPIAMQVICTTTLAIGARVLAEKKVIVSRLNSIEELAGMEVLCIDKTGTLTENKLTVQSAVLAKGVTAEDLFKAVGLACRREDGHHDPIDNVFLQYICEKYPEISYNGYELEEFVDFDPERKRAEGRYRDLEQGGQVTFAKGAPQKIIDLCEMSQMEKQIWRKEMEEQALRGYRTIAVAVAREEDKWQIMGLVPLHDPPRKDTKRTLEKAFSMGIRIKMVTGDQLMIARETGRLLGMSTNFHTFESLSHTENMDASVDLADGFAEVFPQHKFEIVERLKGLNYRVGMTGDGVNDAPALKKADVGIAVSGSTDAARASADIVLIRPGLSVIINAIFTSRLIFQRVKNYCIYRIACTLQLLLFFVIAMVFVNPRDYSCSGDSSCEDIPSYFTFPVFAIVLIAVLNDGTLISIAGDTAIVSKRPDKWNLPILYASSFILGLISLVSSILLLILLLNHMDKDDPSGFFAFLKVPVLTYSQIVTALFLKVAISDFITVFAARTESYFFTHRPSNIVLICAIVATACSTVLALLWHFNFTTNDEEEKHRMKAINGEIVLFIWIYNGVWFLVQDLVKVWTYKGFDWCQRRRGGRPHLRSNAEDVINVRINAEFIRTQHGFVTGKRPRSSAATSCGKLVGN